jgi:hypothetical protein
MFWFLPIILGSALAGGLAGGLVGLILDCIIGEEEVREEVIKVPDAFKFTIMEKKNNAVKCGIYNEQDKHLETLEISSEQGVDSSLKCNTWYYV